MGNVALGPVAAVGLEHTTGGLPATQGDSSSSGGSSRGCWSVMRLYQYVSQVYISMNAKRVRAGSGCECACLVFMPCAKQPVDRAGKYYLRKLSAWLTVSFCCSYLLL